MPRLGFHHVHLPLLQLQDVRSLRWLYVLRVVHSFSATGILFFLAIYFYQFGSTSPALEAVPVTPLQRGLLLIGLYYLGVELVSTFTTLPGARLISKIGYSRSLALASTLRLASYLCLFLSLKYPLLLVGAAVADGIYAVFFWISYHSLVRSLAKNPRLGQDLGLVQFLLQLTGVLAPTLSAVLTTWLGWEALFLLGMLAMLVALIASHHLDFPKPQGVVSLAGFKQRLRTLQFRQASLAFFGRYIHDALYFIWPVYVFLFLGSLEKVGFLYTMSLFIALVVTVVFGLSLDHLKAKAPLYVSGGLVSLQWLLRIPPLSIWGIAVLDALTAVSSNIYWLWYDLLWMRQASGPQAFAYVVDRALVISGLAVVFWAGFLLLVLVMAQPWQLLFSLAAVGVVVSLLVNRRRAP